MISTTSDLTAAVESLVEQCRDFVVVEPHPQWEHCLLFQTWGEVDPFYRRYRDWLSRYCTLNELFALEGFVALLQADGYEVLFTPACKSILEDHERWSRPLEVPGYELKQFQSFCLRQALERASEGRTVAERFFFFNWSAGSGKSFCSGAGARALFDGGEVDLVIACTLSKLKENLRRFYADVAGLNAVVNDHAKPATRRARYADDEVDCFVMNYEKLRVDFDALAEITAGRRVLFVLDETHKIVNEGAHNKARQALDELVKGCHAILWPMSATVVNGNPLRYRDMFGMGSGPRSNPLGTKKDFVDCYADSSRTIPIKTRNGRRFDLETYKWSKSRLQEVRHRVTDRTMAVRKTDAAVADQFKGIECIPLWLQPSQEQRILFALIAEAASKAMEEARARKEAGEDDAVLSLMPFYRLLRYSSINPEVLASTDDPLGQELATKYRDLCSAAHSPKIEVLNDMLEGIAQAEDKAVLFCHYTHMGLLPLMRHVNAPHVLHYGEQSARESQRAQDRFKTEPELTCFASSDAGSHGLNLPVARYVINIDPTYSYDDLMQRNSRIDRLDSHLSGLTAYVLLIEDSVEERVWQICNERREIAAAIQGTAEELSYGSAESRSEAQNLEFLIFGSNE